jgi:hypothetical protein
MKPSVLVLLPFLGLALLAGMFSGWARLGWAFAQAPTPGGGAAQHGAIMVGGFLGSLVLLEKVALLRQPGWLALPLVNALSVPLFWLGQPGWGLSCLLAGATAMLGVAFYFWRKHPGPSTLLWLAGSLMLGLGHAKLAWHGFYPAAVPYWMGFFLLVVVGERLELSRFLPVSRPQYWLLGVFLAVWSLGILAWPFHSAGFAWLSLLLTGVAAWLWQHDMPRRALARPGLTRFVAINLLVGYGWLGLAGLWPWFPLAPAFAYDAYLHLYFIGFVLSMVLAHGPIVLPGVLGVNIKPFHPGLYGWSGLVQLGLLARLLGDVTGWTLARQWGSLANGLGLLGYLAMVAILIAHGRKKSPQVLPQKPSTYEYSS